MQQPLRFRPDYGECQANPKNPACANVPRGEATPRPCDGEDECSEDASSERDDVRAALRTVKRHRPDLRPHVASILDRLDRVC